MLKKITNDGRYHCWIKPIGNKFKIYRLDSKSTSVQIILESNFADDMGEFKNKEEANKALDRFLKNYNSKHNNF